MIGKMSRRKQAKPNRLHEEEEDQEARIEDEGMEDKEARVEDEEARIEDEEARMEDEEARLEDEEARIEGSRQRLEDVLMDDRPDDEEEMSHQSLKGENLFIRFTSF